MPSSIIHWHVPSALGALRSGVQVGVLLLLCGTLLAAPSAASPSSECGSPAAVFEVAPVGTAGPLSSLVAVNQPGTKLNTNGGVGLASAGSQNDAESRMEKLMTLVSIGWLHGLVLH